MIARHFPALAISRRTLLALPLLFLPWTQTVSIRSSGFERITIQQVIPQTALAPPLTLGMARVVLQSGAATWAATPGGARILVVESGGVEVSAAAHGDASLSLADFSAAAPPRVNDALFLPAGTAMPFGALGVLSMRNPGKRAAVILDAAIYPEEPRPLVRAFTTNDGVSFQLLAYASTSVAPAGRAIVTLERLALGADTELPPDASSGLSIMYVEAGTVDLLPRSGQVYAARAAASAPYAMPGSLQPLAVDARRDVTAGGVIFLTMGAVANIRNTSTRPATILALTVREERGANVAKSMNPEERR